jgi:hypothetical protein
MHKHSITKKKFYGKWLYKATLRIPGIAVLRMNTLDDTIDLSDKSNLNEYVGYHYYKKVFANKEDITSLCQYLKSLSIEDWYKRIERDNIDLYTNDPEIYNGLIDRFQHILYLTSEPDISRKQEYEDKHHILCKKLPHDRYRYRVFLKPHKMNSDRSAKQSYINWLENQNNVLISQAVKNWFIATDWNWDPRYILVEDHKTLLFLHMRNSEVLGRIYEYVLSDK